MTENTKLNLGCGKNLMPEYINVDKFGKPDIVCDLEEFPWPWEDNSIDEIVMFHVLEHLGETSEIYLKIFMEMYRILKPGALVRIAVPHPRHDDFINDPTHVRPVTPDSLALFSKKLNRIWDEKDASNTPLGEFLGIDFEIVSVNNILEEPWSSQRQSGEINDDQLLQLSRQFNNVIRELRIDIRTIK